MQAYEQGKPAYFATPPVNLIYAFHVSLKQIVEGSPSLEERFRLHREASSRIKKAVSDLGLKQVLRSCIAGLLFWSTTFQIPINDSVAANGMTAVSLAMFSLYIGLSKERRSITLLEFQRAICCHVWLIGTL